MGEFSSIQLANMDMGQNQVKNLSDPIDPGDSTNKSTSDRIVQVSDSKQSVKVSSSAALPTCTYDSLTKQLTASANEILLTTWCYSYVLDVGHRVLIKNQADLSQNGIYDVIDLGSVSTPWILQRSDDFDADDEVVGGVVYDEYTKQLFIVTSVEPFTIGVSDVTFKTSTSGIIIGESKTITSGTYNALLADVPIIFIDGSGGNLTINGLTGGVAGQTIQLIKTTLSGRVTLANNNASGTQKIFMFNNANWQSSINNYMNRKLTCNGTAWFGETI